MAQITYFHTYNNEYENMTAQVESSVIKQLSWSAKGDKSVLSITFTNGSVYIYKGVDRISFANLLQAESVGVRFNETVRNSYEYVNVTDQPFKHYQLVCMEIDFPLATEVGI
jgi:hypothetical protein